MSKWSGHERMPKRLPPFSVFAFALHTLLLVLFPWDALGGEIDGHLPISGVSDRNTRFLMGIDGLNGIVLLDLGKNRFYFGSNDQQISLYWK